MIRIFYNQLLSTFVPTFLLWLFGYSTLFINIENSSDRFMGAATALLVVATLLNVINQDLPQTSYMKLLDIWFMWHMLNIFAIITHHIIIDRMRKRFESVCNDEVRLVQPDDNENLGKKDDGSNRISGINQTVIMVLPLLNGIFYGIYFYFTLN